MHILQATGDIRKVSLWLGHASIQSTEIYLRADPTEKLDALAMGIPPALKRGKFKAPDKLMAMFKEVGTSPCNYAKCSTARFRRRTRTGRRRLHIIMCSAYYKIVK